MSHILLFGGTFDPVHNGHVAMLNCAIDTIRPDETWVLPAGAPWQKSGQPLAAAHRIAMLRLSMPDAVIDTREVDRAGSTYTVDTLARLHAEYPGDTFCWLIGSDSFKGLNSWCDPKTLATLTSFAVVRRATEAIVVPSGKAEFRYQEVVCAPSPVSSTDIRKRCLRGESIRGLVPDAVCDYIQQHHLYHFP